MKACAFMVSFGLFFPIQTNVIWFKPEGRSTVESCKLVLVESKIG